MTNRVSVFAVCLLLSTLNCAKKDGNEVDVSDQTTEIDSPAPSNTTYDHGTQDSALPSDEAECVFQIDLAQSRRLVYAQFERDFPRAYLRLSFEINSLGHVVRTFDHGDGGQPAAMDRFEKSVRTWRYSGGCLKGTLCIGLNTSNRLVLIDDRGLEAVSGFENRVIKRGRMHNVFGGNIRVQKTQEGICD